MIEGSNANMILGQNEEDGDIFVRDGDGNTTIQISGSTGDISASDVNLRDDEFARINMRATSPDNDVRMFIDARGDGTNRGQLGTFSDHELHIVTNNATRMVVSENGNVGIGVTDPQSQLEVNGQVQANGILFSDGSVQTTATLVGPRGPRGEDGDILLFPSSATNNHTVDQATIHLDANAGEITFSNADCAEEFTIAEAIDAIPGSVMVLNDDGLLQPSNRAYDKRVVGIISGAGKYKPGLLLDKQDRESNRSPIAIMGKVYCMATADVAPINVGDLLTTSHISGHAMKVTDEHKAFGAVVGKALAPFTDGTGLIPVLLALQ
ncbi:hypothetical protein [Coleofasciculus chthonoplastes]|nr:hypothetical protein [Coleofasciculus chthonoplastes]